MKKISITGLSFVTLALTASLASGLMSGHVAKANNSSGVSSSSAGSSAAQDTGVVLPKTAIYALNNDNTLYVLPPGATGFIRLLRVTQVNGSLIGIDYR